MSSFNLKALIRDIAKRNLAHAKDCKVLLLLAVDTRIPEQLLGDKARLKPLISCFIINGINQCRRPGTCTVMAALTNEDKDVYRVRFAVRDDGKGLSADEILELYNPLRSTSHAPVSLHPFKLIVEAHRGWVDVRSSNVGNEFSFEIPFKLSHDAVANVEVLNKTFNVPLPKISSKKELSMDSIISKTDESKMLLNVKNGKPKIADLVSTTKGNSLPKAVHAVQSSKLDSQSKANTALIIHSNRVLVVDDVLSNRMMTGRVLERFGFEVDYAEDGQIAVNKCRNYQYGLIVMDNMMPVMTGKDATTVLRKQNYRGLVVGLTGNVLDEDLEEFRESGCDEVITKPLDVPELRRTLISLGLAIPKKEISAVTE